MKTKNRYRVSMIIFLLVLSTILLFRILTKRVMPVLMIYAKQKSEKIATLVINDAISKSVLESLTMDNLFLITKNDIGEIISIDFNSIIVNKILSTTTNAIETSLKYVEDGRMQELDVSDSLAVQYENHPTGHFLEVPLGVFFKNPFLANFGPSIPIQLHLVGAIVSNVETKITNYGINNAMIEVYVHIEVSLQVILPFISDNVKVDTLVPIAMKLVRGNVPEYYGGTLSSPLISVPVN